MLNYNGVSGDANWAAPVPLIQDGDVWQFGDPTSGTYGMFKPILDRLANLKATAGLLAQNNTWTGSNIFQPTGSGKAVTFGSNLDEVAVFCPFTFGGGGILNIGGGAELDILNTALLRVRSGATLQLDAGSTYTDAGNRTISGNTTFNGVATFNAAATFTGPTFRTGGNATRGLRFGSVSHTASTPHVDTTKDVWEMEKDPTGDQEVRIDAPADPTHDYVLTISRNKNAGSSSHHTVTVKDDGSGVTLAIWEPQAFDPSNIGLSAATASDFAYGDFHWDIGLAQWVCFRGSIGGIF